MLIFGVKSLLSLKNCQMRPQNSFWRFSLKIKLFSNKLHQISDKKGYIHFWCKMTSDRSHSDTVGRVANKVRVNLYFYGPKYRSSEALPAPEIV